MYKIIVEVRKKIEFKKFIEKLNLDVVCWDGLDV